MSNKNFNIYGDNQGIKEFEYDDETVTHEQKVLGSFNLDVNEYIHLKVSMQKNLFKQKDNNLFGFKEEEEFFSVPSVVQTNKFKNRKYDTSDPEYSSLKDTLLVVDISNSNKKTTVTRKVRNLKDWISSIAGLPTLLLLWATLFSKRYQKFNSEFEVYDAFHNQKSEDHHPTHIHNHHRRSKLLQFLFQRSSFFQKIYSCFISKES